MNSRENKELSENITILDQKIVYCRKLSPIGSFVELEKLLEKNSDNLILEYYVHFAYANSFCHLYLRDNNKKRAEEVFQKYNLSLSHKLPLWIKDTKSSVKGIRHDAIEYYLPLLVMELDKKLSDQTIKNKDFYLIHRGYIQWLKREDKTYQNDLTVIAKLWSQILYPASLAKLQDDQEIHKIIGELYFHPDNFSPHLTKSQCHLIAFMTSRSLASQGDKNAVDFINWHVLNEDKNICDLEEMHWDIDKKYYEKKIIDLFLSILVEISERLQNDIKQESDKLKNTWFFTGEIKEKLLLFKKMETVVNQQLSLNVHKKENIIAICNAIHDLCKGKDVIPLPYHNLLHHVYFAGEEICNVSQFVFADRDVLDVDQVEQKSCKK